MIAIFKTVTGIYHYCNMSEASRPFVVNKCMYVWRTNEPTDWEQYASGQSRNKNIALRKEAGPASCSTY